ncbi:MAG: PAS domain S-box protein [Chloroflexia bacterium]|nr:PAS domain S-box protein [Chloroflexia bacterium]
MHHNKPSYQELFEENNRLKKLLTSLTSESTHNEYVTHNAQLNEYIEELEQTFETLRVQKEELEKIKTRFHLLEDNISDIIWMMDLKGHLTFVSSSASKVFGYSVDEFSGLEVSDILTEESYLLHKAMLEKRIAQEKEGILTTGASIELMHVRKGGEPFWAEVSSNPLRNSKNKLIGLVGVTRDITQRISTENEIRKLSVVVEQNPASIVITDVEGKIEYVNTTFCKVTGYPFDEAVGRNPRILKSGKTHQKFMKIYG